MKVNKHKADKEAYSMSLMTMQALSKEEISPTQFIPSAHKFPEAARILAYYKLKTKAIPVYGDPKSTLQFFSATKVKKFHKRVTEIRPQQGHP